MAGGTFPTSVPSYVVTAGSEVLNSVSGGVGLSGLLNNFETDITALATKLGSGSSTSSNNTVLAGNGAGTSTWTATLTSLTLVTPTIASFTNAQHDHSNAAGGGNIVSAAIPVSAVTPEKLLTGTGTTWVYQNWTPTFTNITVGNGSLTAKFTQIGKHVEGYLIFILGSTSAVGAGPTFSLPVTANTSMLGSFWFTPIGLAVYSSNTTGLGNGALWLNTATTALPVVWNATATYVTEAGLSSTTPGNWATGYTMHFTFSYEAA